MPAESLRLRVARLVDPISFADCYTGTGLKEHRRRDALATADAILSEIPPLIREAGEGLEPFRKLGGLFGADENPRTPVTALDADGDADLIVADLRNATAIHAKIMELTDAEG